jgi:NAD(P)-dependent dehydrogenase (short-subunit alcohol dehydrogenase family)
MSSMAIIAGERALQPTERELQGRVALVTGGTRGIGAAISRALATNGASVAAGYASNHERAEQLQNELTRYGSHMSLHRGDVSSAEDCRRVVREVIALHGRLDILVNNAGITADSTVLKLRDDDWYNVLAVNLSGAFFTAQTALAHMLDRGTGRIINISSIIGQTGNVGQSNYAASKSGLFGLTMSLAKEAAFALKRSGRLSSESANITVNAIAPGFIETEMLAGVPEKALERVRAQIPLDRLGRAEEVARVAAFLASDASAYITGQVWAVNGGMEM